MKRKITALIMALMLGTTIIGCGEKTKTEKTIEYTTKNENMKITTSDKWTKEEDAGNYDLQVFNKQVGYNGFFVDPKSDLADNVDMKEILKMQVDSLISTRENANLIEDISSKEENGKTFYTTLYSAEKDSQKNYYYFTLIDFGKDKDLFAISIQTCIPSDFDDARAEIDKINASAEALK